jgi:hypothetical protein
VRVCPASHRPIRSCCVRTQNANNPPGPSILNTTSGFVSFQLIVKNNGDFPLSNINVTDDRVSLGTRGNVGNLAVGGSKTISYHIR